jgi:cytoskeletal protein CcmA (bactofilin family)
VDVIARPGVARGQAVVCWLHFYPSMSQHPPSGVLSRLWRRFRRSSSSRSRLTAFIDDAAEIEGKYRCTGTVMLNARFKGEIVSTGTLIIGDQATVEANIDAATVVVSGEVIGKVVATERLELRARATLVGDIETPLLIIAEGARFDGQCRCSTS